jgi:LysR family transcriptional regulator, benzoate and cis,cis-muconate-responsive activator of ben and cat genes
MELRQLRYFVSIAALQHFRKAAIELNVAQPALSRQIKLLEMELGGPVFERLPRGVRLTEAGEAFLEDAKRLLQNLDDAVGRTRCLASGHAGSLRVSFTEASSWGGIVPETIMTFRSAEPGVQMILLPLDSATQLTGLQDRTIDAAFLYEDQDFAPQIRSRRMETERIMVAVPPGHRLSRRRSVQLSDLIGEPVIWTQSTQNPRFHQRLMTACIAGGLVPRIVQEASTLAILLSLVEVGVGFGFERAAIAHAQARVGSRPSLSGCAGLEP